MLASSRESLQTGSQTISFPDHLVPRPSHSHMCILAFMSEAPCTYRYTDVFVFVSICICQLKYICVHLASRIKTYYNFPIKQPISIFQHHSTPSTGECSSSSITYGTLTELIRIIGYTTVCKQSVVHTTCILQVARDIDS